MKTSRAVLLALFVLVFALAACEEAPPTDANPNAVTTPTPSSSLPVGGTAAAQETPFANPQTPPPDPVAQTNYCKNGGAITIKSNEPLAAKVNGQPISLAQYQRQLAQEQSTLVAQGLDPKSKSGQETLKGLGQQILGQLIDDALVEQAAHQENISVSGQDVDNRIQQMIDDAGGRDKFDNYLKTTQLALDDLCTEIRASIFGEIMLTRVTAALPIKVEQVHAARILLASQAEANQVLTQLKAGKDFAALAKQYSKDESTRDNGGDLGWLPKGILTPEMEAVAFQLAPGQISGIIQDQVGFEIVKVIERDPARELSPELLQYQRQQAFLAWLDAQRNKAKIEKLVNP